MLSFLMTTLTIHHIRGLLCIFSSLLSIILLWTESFFRSTTHLLTGRQKAACDLPAAGFILQHLPPIWLANRQKSATQPFSWNFQANAVKKCQKLWIQRASLDCRIAALWKFIWLSILQLIFLSYYQNWFKNHVFVQYNFLWSWFCLQPTGTTLLLACWQYLCTIFTRTCMRIMKIDCIRIKAYWLPCNKWNDCIAFSITVFYIRMYCYFSVLSQTGKIGEYYISIQELTCQSLNTRTINTIFYASIFLTPFTVS